MFSGKIGSYNGYVNSKRKYLKRKKELNRELRRLKKIFKSSRGLRRRYCKNQISKCYDDIYILNLMYHYYKREIGFLTLKVD